MIGDSAELAVAQRFLSAEYYVSQPFSEDCPYDLVVEIENELKRIQVKSVSQDDNKKVNISLERTNYGASGSKRKYYKKNEVDLIAAYCRVRDEVLIFDFDEIPKTSVTCRFDYEGNHSAVRKAEDFLFSERFK
jgi:hypothetical protein